MDNPRIQSVGHKYMPKQIVEGGRIPVMIKDGSENHCHYHCGNQTHKSSLKFPNETTIANVLKETMRMRKSPLKFQESGKQLLFKNLSIMLLMFMVVFRYLPE